MITIWYEHGFQIPMHDMDCKTTKIIYNICVRICSASNKESKIQKVEPNPNAQKSQKVF